MRGRPRSPKSYRVCNGCKQSFYPRVNQFGQRVGKGERKYCFICMPYEGTTRSSRTRIVKGDILGALPTEKCENCGRTRRKHSRLCGVCHRLYRRFQLKFLCMRYMGAKCQDCSRTSNMRDDFGLYDYHHVRGEKMFEIGDAINSLNKTWEMIRMELDKCVCLCAVCHRIKHPTTVPQLFLDILSSENLDESTHTW